MQEAQLLTNWRRLTNSPAGLLINLNVPKLLDGSVASVPSAAIDKSFLPERLMTVSALADLYDEYGPRLYRYALLILTDAALAEDAVQEAFCAVARAQGRDSGVATLAYLTTSVRNECYSLLRKRRTRGETRESLLEPVAPGASEEERVMLEGVLRVLPPEQREAVHLKVYEGLTFQEIGERCGISQNTAASRYRYALEALRRALDVDRSRT